MVPHSRPFNRPMLLYSNLLSLSRLNKRRLNSAESVKFPTCYENSNVTEVWLVEHISLFALWLLMKSNRFFCLLSTRWNFTLIHLEEVKFVCSLCLNFLNLNHATFTTFILCVSGHGCCEKDRVHKDQRPRQTGTGRRHRQHPRRGEHRPHLGDQRWRQIGV